MLPVLGTVLVLAAGAGGVASAVLGSRVGTWVGDHSYALYLWHWPLIVLWKRVFRGARSAFSTAPP